MKFDGGGDCRMIIFNNDTDVDVPLYEMSRDELVGRLFALLQVRDKVGGAAACCGFLGLLIPVVYLISLFLNLCDQAEFASIVMLLIAALTIGLLSVSSFSILFLIYLREKIRETEAYVARLRE